MAEQIYIDELECPHCDEDTYNESWDIEVDPDREEVTEVICEFCGKSFYVHTRLSIHTTKSRE